MGKLKLYIYGYLNQMQSSRRLEREAGRNVELMWLTGKLAPDFKTIADFRRDHGVAIQAACRRFVLVCRNLGLIAGGTVAVDGSRLRAVNARDRNFTPVTIRRRMEQVDASIVRYLGMLDTADRQESDAAELRTARLTTRLGELRRQMRELEAMEEAVMASPDRQISLTDPDARAMASAGTGTGLVGYNLQAAVDTDSHIIVAHEVINLAAALREVGRIERTLFTLRWFKDPALRQLVTAEFNKGEARNSLARAVAFHRLGRFRYRGLENQQLRSSALTLVTAAIILFNCRYLGRAVAELQRRGNPLDPALLPHLSPLGWDRINLTGDYVPTGASLRCFDWRSRASV